MSYDEKMDAKISAHIEREVNRQVENREKSQKITGIINELRIEKGVSEDKLTALFSDLWDAPSESIDLIRDKLLPKEQVWKPPSEEVLKQREEEASKWRRKNKYGWTD